ncbi:MAG TPA: hypothetical protein VGW34_12025 [Allosphingosinicella sp.]|nr:hypothetical protein [Allosphingosinicella sp.]
MKAFEFIRSKLSDEEVRYASGASSTIVGTVICRAIMHEAVLEDRRLKDRQAPRSDEALLMAALSYCKDNWSEEMSKAQTRLEARAMGLLDDRLKKALEFGLQDAAAQETPVWFAIWTGVLANTLWLVLGAALLLLGLLLWGNSLEDAMKFFLKGS